ncbi:hypothetical protein KUCAC02_032181, partial [Chaenocephalus aceratus]
EKRGKVRPHSRVRGCSPPASLAVDGASVSQGFSTAVAQYCSRQNQELLRRLH